MNGWKDGKMVLAGKKAQITRLKNEGKIDEARKLEETLMNHIEMPKPALPKMDLREIRVKYDVPCPAFADSSSTLPWVEKYRPVSLLTLIGPVAPYLRAYVKTGGFPLAMVFYGDYGQGKTAAARAFIRDYYVNSKVFNPSASFMDVLHSVNWMPEYEGCWSPALQIDATVTSEVEVIRERVQTFMRVRAMWNSAGAKLKKFILFDEADRLGYASQGVLRSLLEKYPGTVTIYTTNRIEGVDPAIVSRASGGVFEFKKPDKEVLTKHLCDILRWEQKTLSLSTLEEIAVSSQSVREAVGRLQQEIAIGECE
jgi:DNA polymerase III delta prime subunit